MTVVLLLVLVLQFVALGGHALNVTFDHRAFLINDVRTLLIAGSVHYPRAHSAEWPSILASAKASGINLIQTYVFWDIHEPLDGHFYFPSDGSSEDLVAFLAECQRQDLFVNLRFGPYVCAEWSYGGFPGWLREVEEITYRTMNKPFLQRMLRFIDQTLAVVQDANMLASEDGPVIMLQIENEYGNMQRYYPHGDEYVQYLADYALQKNLSIPWTMCQQGEGVGSAPPAAIVNTCNGYYCDDWISKHAADFPQQPHMWTENWPGWFQTWGQPVPHRPAVDVAFAVARWFARGGTYMNYYMLFGGTSFGRHAGGPLIITSYDYDVQINEYTLPAEPKYSLTRLLHEALIAVAPVLLSTDEIPTAEPLSSTCESHTYQKDSKCVQFLSNWGARDACTFVVSGMSFEVPVWSVSIVNDACTSSPVQLINTRNDGVSIGENKLVTTLESEMSLLNIQVFHEPIPSTNAESVTAPSPLDQLSLTQDTTDYLWISSLVTRTSAGTSYLSYHYGAAGGPVAYVFVNGKLQATTITDTSLLQSNVHTLRNVLVDDASLRVTLRVQLEAGDSRIDILSATTGLKNYGPYLEHIQAGITSNVTVDEDAMSPISHIVGLTGEKLRLFDMNDDAAGEYFTAYTDESPAQPLSWYRAHVLTPALYSPDAPLAIDISGSSLIKGSVWVNGFMLGRYWTIRAEGRCDTCSSGDYVGAYNAERCRTGCGDMSQHLYKIPFGLLHTGKGRINTIVFLDELGGRPDGVTFQRISME